jgi:hypothetical protein
MGNYIGRNYTGISFRLLDNNKYICYNCDDMRERSNILFSNKVSVNKLKLDNLIEDLNKYKCIDKYKCCDKEGGRRLKLVEYDTRVRNENKLKLQY